jgi:hypothetical protein
MEGPNARKTFVAGEARLPLQCCECTNGPVEEVLREMLKFFEAPADNRD